MRFKGTMSNETKSWKRSKVKSGEDWTVAPQEGGRKLKAF